MKIKLLIVDDSAFMRTAVRLMIKDDPDIEIVGEARDGADAIRMVETLAPDVVTMDIEMPGMDGLAATQHIMAHTPLPIIMLSSLTERGAVATIKALELGAVDFIPKKSSFVQLDIVQIGKELHEKIRYWGRRHLHLASGRLKARRVEQTRGTHSLAAGYTPDLVVVGVSTGGPAIIPHLLQAMGKLVCPVVIAQHMPLLFTEGFAKHLRAFSGLNVLQASEGMVLTPGMVAVCPGGSDTVVRETLQGRLMVSLKCDPTVPIHPSADVLFESAARLKRRIAVVIMTGMGTDGTSGARTLSQQGCPVLVQEPEECVVDGMPMSAIDAGIVSDVMKAVAIGQRLRKWAGASAEPPRFINTKGALHV